MPSWGELLLELQPHTDANGNTVAGLSFDDLRTKYIYKLSEYTRRNVIAYYSGWLKPLKSQNDGDVMKSTIDFQKEEYEALMKVLGLDNGESTDEENDTDKYFDAWNFGRTDEDSNFFATATLT